jgi:hypothetical protein
LSYNTLDFKLCRHRDLGNFQARINASLVSNSI